MKILILLLSLLFASDSQVSEAQAYTDEQVFAQADWNWREIGRGAQVGYAQLPLFNSVQSISVIRYRASKFRTDVINDPASESATTSAMALRHKAVAAVNGSYFNMKTLDPMTFIKEDGVQEGWTSPKEYKRVDGVLAIRGRKVEIFRCDTVDYAVKTRKYQDVMAAGPVLLLNGVAPTLAWPNEGYYIKRHPRTFVGTTADGWVYLVVIDGRLKGQADGVSLAEETAIAGMFGLKDVINLDGGGSSALWTEKYGLESYPCDNKVFEHNGERTIPNVLIIR